MHRATKILSFKGIAPAKINALAFVVFFVWQTVGTMAQVDTGVLSGSITDETGAVLPAVAVTITSQATGLKTEVLTNDVGLYVSPPLRPGRYRISAELAGFKSTSTVTTLEINQRAVVNFVMGVGAISERVEVAAEAPLLESETSALGNVRTEKAIKELPLNGRNFVKLFELTPGTAPLLTQSGGLPIVMKRGTPITAVNGLRGEDNNVLVEGVNNSENHNGLGILVYPPLDALQEFKVQTNASDAQFGRAGGAIINLTLKSGGRDFHGNLFEFLRNSALDAKNFFDPPGKIPHFVMNQFGGTFGGPVTIPGLYNRDRSKTFFFVDYEGIRLRQSQTFVSTVPTAEFRRGDFSASPFRIYDPVTTRRNPSGPGLVREPFPNNVIPSERIDPVGRNLASLYPLPNLAGIVNNFVYNPIRRLDTDNFDIKIDHQASEADALAFRYSQGNTKVFEPSFLPPPAVGAGPGPPGTNRQPHRQFMASYTHTLSPNKINEARFGFTRLNLRSEPANFGRNVAQEVGIAGVNIAGDVLTSGLTIVDISGYRSLGDSGFSPAILVSENYQWSDNFNYIRGKHTMKFGLEIQRRRYNAYQSFSPRGTLTVGRIFTTNPASPAGTGDGLADLLLGVPSNGTIQIVSGTRGFRRSEFGFYLQDDYKLTSNLMLNLGLRYELFSKWPWVEVADRQAQFIPERGEVFLVRSPEVPDGSGTKTDYNNVAPRIGLAYKLTRTIVVRAGYGIFYTAAPWSIDRTLATNPPFVGRFTFSNDQGNFLGGRRIAQGFERPAAFPTEGASLNAVNVHVRTPYVQQWNLNVQQQLPGDILFMVAYVGTKGTKLLYFPNINRARPGPGSVAARRPYPRFSDIRLFSSEANSVYHGLQISADKRFLHGLSFLSSYTWSHCIDEVGGATQQMFETVQDPLNRRGDRGRCGFDLRQRFLFSYNYELPFGSGKRFLADPPAAMRYAIDGWQINGIASLYSGFPFTPTSAVNTLNSPGSQRANLVPGCHPELPRSQRTLDRFFNVGCFTTPPAFAFGNAGRNILTGPGTVLFDFSLFKNVHINGDQNRYVQFRAEFFNLFNRPQFNEPNASIGSAAAGSIRNAGSPLTFSRTSRQIQLALKLFY